MKRREAIQLVTLTLGAFLSESANTNALGLPANQGTKMEVSPSVESLLAEVADVIIPTTDTPGAKAAGVEQFIIRVLRDCHKPEEQRNFYEGLAALDEHGAKRFGAPFAQLTAEQKKEALKEFAPKNKAFFSKMKQLTVTGYFTSEIGATKALAYLPIPGRFQGSVPMEPGQKAWAL
jgi:hypothetical protein